MITEYVKRNDLESIQKYCILLVYNRLQVGGKS